MKKAVLILGICGVIAACSNSEESGARDSVAGANQSRGALRTDTGTANSGPGSAGASANKGEELISKSDCLSCHKVDVKLLGPAYQEVADKYPATDANIEMLAGKIIKGGAGNWGDIPMTPHPSISENDAMEMVKYILSLKK